MRGGSTLQKSMEATYVAAVEEHLHSTWYA